MAKTHQSKKEKYLRKYPKKRPLKSSIKSVVSSAQDKASTARLEISKQVNVLLASDLAHHIEHFLGRTFNEGSSTIYDRAIDQVYRESSIGGGKLHRLFDGSHTPWKMWEKVHAASPDDTLMQEVSGYAASAWKDMSSPVGLPLVDMNPGTFHTWADFLKTHFHIPRDWTREILHVNTPQLVGSMIAFFAVALHWNKSEVKEFSELAGSLGIASMASANPLLAIITLTALSKGFMEAKNQNNYKHVIDGFSQGGIVTGGFILTASVVGGPVWIGLTAGFGVTVVLTKTKENYVPSKMATRLRKPMNKTIHKIPKIEAEKLKKSTEFLTKTTKKSLMATIHAGKTVKKVESRLKQGYRNSRNVFSKLSNLQSKVRAHYAIFT